MDVDFLSYTIIKNTITALEQRIKVNHGVLQVIVTKAVGKHATQVSECWEKK